MRSFITKAGIVTALAAAAFIGPSVTGALAATDHAPATASAVASDPLGPFEQLSGCLGRGNKGIEDGEWPDYECVGSPGAWYVQPIYN